MFASVVAIIMTSFFGQNKITEDLRHLELADDDFEEHFGIVVNMGRRKLLIRTKCDSLCSFICFLKDCPIWFRKSH